MDKKTRFAANFIGYLFLLAIVPKLNALDMEAAAAFLAIIAIIGIIYEIYVYTTNPKSTSGAATAAIFCVIIIAAIATFANPGIQEDIEDGRVIIPSNEATVTITIENNHVLVGKDYDIYRDGSFVKTIHLRAWENHTMIEKVKWVGFGSKQITYKIVSSGAGGIGDRTSEKTITLKNNDSKTITLSA